MVTITFPPSATRLIDHASASSTSISKESRLLVDHVADQRLNLVERLEAYEDIINLEVGDTNFTRARNLERESGLRQVYLKFEGNNPTGTQKDRIAFAQCLDALRRGYECVTVATCGNYGAAIAFAAKLASLRAVICIPEGYSTQRLDEIAKHGGQLRRVPGTYEDVVTRSQQWAAEHDWYDANPGGANQHLQLSAYAQIAFEIYDTLRDAPKVVAAPVSNGTMLAGIYRGFVTLHKRGKTSRIPRMVAASSFRNNPIISSWKQQLSRCNDLCRSSIHETSTNEPLVNWHSFDGNEALDAIRISRGWAADISDKKLIRYSKLLKDKEGLSVLPASTAGLIALLAAAESAEGGEFEGDRYVAVLTGRR